MPKNNFFIQNDVKLKVLHEKEIERTTLTLYVKLPSKYCLILKDIITTPDLKVPHYDKKTIKDYYKKIDEENPGNPEKKEKKDKFLKNVKGKYGKDWRKISFHSTFNFCIINCAEDSERTEYMHYQLAGTDHSVDVNISECDGNDIPQFVLENLLLKYTEKNN